MSSQVHTRAPSPRHAHRVLRLGGTPIVSVPHRGLVHRATRTGLGLAELVALARPLLGTAGGSRLVIATLAWTYLAAYLLEDPWPMGPLGYHLIVRARAQEECP